MLHLTPHGGASYAACPTHAVHCSVAACPPRTAFRTGPAQGMGIANRCQRTRTSRQKRRFTCNAKKSKRKRAAERLEERTVDEDLEAAAQEPLDTEEQDLADTTDTTYEVLDEEPLQQQQQQQQYQSQAAAPPPQAPSSSGDLVKLGALGLGAVALIAAVVFAVKQFSKRQLPEEEKVHQDATQCVICLCTHVQNDDPCSTASCNFLFVAAHDYKRPNHAAQSGCILCCPLHVHSRPAVSLHTEA